MTDPRAALRALLDAPEPFIAADCYSALTARIVEHVRFKAAYMGGHATGMMHRAIPDSGVFSPVEMIEISSHVAEAIDIPLGDPYPPFPAFTASVCNLRPTSRGPCRGSRVSGMAPSRPTVRTPSRAATSSS